MYDVSTYQVIGSLCTLVVTGITFSKIFFKRVDTLEATFKSSVTSINDNLIRVDKNLAVNTALIDQILKKGSRHDG